MGALKKEIIKPSGILAKRTMNFGATEKKKTDYKFIAAIVIAIVIATLIGKTQILDKLDTIDSYKREYEDLERQCEELKVQTADYDEISNTYDHFTYDYLTSEEAVYTGRQEMLAIIEEQVWDLATITSVSVDNNLATVVLNNASLNCIATAMTNLLEDEHVNHVMVYNADTGDQLIWDPEDDTKCVTAKMIIYFRDYEKVTEAITAAEEGEIESIDWKSIDLDEKMYDFDAIEARLAEAKLVREVEYEKEDTESLALAKQAAERFFSEEGNDIIGRTVYYDKDSDTIVLDGTMVDGYGKGTELYGTKSEDGKPVDMVSMGIQYDDSGNVSEAWYGSATAASGKIVAITSDGESLSYKWIDPSLAEYYAQSALSIITETNNTKNASEESEETENSGQNTDNADTGTQYTITEGGEF